MSNSAASHTLPVLARAAVWLVSGALVLVLLLIAYIALARPSADVRPLLVNLEPEMVRLGKGQMEDDALAVTTDGRGAAGLKLAWKRVPADNYPLLHIRFSTAPANASATLAWSTDNEVLDKKPLRKGDIVSKDYWLYLPGNPLWDGVVGDLKLVLRGEPGARFLIESISLRPLSAQGLAGSSFDRGPTGTWTQSSINFHRLAPAGRGPLQAALTAALLILFALSGYGLWCRSMRRRFDLRVGAAIVVAGWILLDLLWMSRLVHQVDATHQQFAGRSAEERLSHGHDAALYRFVSEVKNRLTTDDPELRLFVASSSLYKGMRTAYYLYPNNVYWRRKRSEMLDAGDLRSGDHIVLVSPTKLEIDRRRSALVLPDSDAVAVEPVLVDRDGMLLKVR